MEGKGSLKILKMGNTLHASYIDAQRVLPIPDMGIFKGFYPLNRVLGAKPLESDFFFAADFKEHSQGDDSGESEYRGDGGGNAVIAADNLGVDFQGHGLGMGGIQNDGGG